MVYQPILDKPINMRRHCQKLCVSCFRSLSMNTLVVVSLVQFLMIMIRADTSSDGFRVLELRSLTKRFERYIEDLKTKHMLDTLTHGGAFDQSSTQLLVRPDVLPFIVEELEGFGIPYQDRTGHIYSAFKNESSWRSKRKRRAVTEPSSWAYGYRFRFLTLREIDNFLQALQASTGPKSTLSLKATVGSIGKSAEGKDTPYIKISQKNHKDREKPVVFIDAGIHGREWIAPAMAIEIIYQLIFNPSDDPDVDTLRSMYDWVIVPVVNPDGYQFTFSNNISHRLWRKSRTRQYSTDPLCYGVDLNRNFGFQWNDGPYFGGSSDPCSPTFSGPSGFSEPETRNLRELLQAHRSSMQAYLSFHSFGQFFLYPWGFSPLVDLEDESDLHHVASVFAEMMKKKNYDYQVGGTAKILYPAAGGSNDYVKGSLGVKYAYTIELPPYKWAQMGFLMPEPEIKRVVLDTWQGLKELCIRLHGKLSPLPSNRNSTTRRSTSH